MEYGNGIMGDMCVHCAGHGALDAGSRLAQVALALPEHLCAKGRQIDIADTQSAIFEYEELNCVWQHRSWGGPADPEYPWSV